MNPSGGPQYSSPAEGIYRMICTLVQRQADRDTEGKKGNDENKAAQKTAKDASVEQKDSEYITGDSKE